MGLHKPGTVRMTGSIRLDGTELIGAKPEQVRELRGKRMAMIFQDPLSAMHPFYTVGHQIIEAYRIHNKVSTAVAKKHAIDMLGRVGIPQPSSRVDDYPHQFSGGMRQRAMIAMALSCDPDLLIADEPTTALDVTVQAQILDLIRDLQSEFNSAVILITHDLGVVAELSDDIMVMYAGRSVEYASADEVFTRPQHPYTWGLLELDAAPRPGAHRAPAPDQGRPAEPHQRAVGLPVPPAVRVRRPHGRAQPVRAAAVRRDATRATTPRATSPARSGPPSGRTTSGRRCDARTVRPRPVRSSTARPQHRSPIVTTTHVKPTASKQAGEALLQVDGLTKHFPIKRGLLQRQVGAVQAVDGLTFDVMRGETLSLVGESGCGKTTTGRMLTRLLEPTGGTILLEGDDITHWSAGQDAPAAPRRADDLPGPLRLAEPAAHRRHHRRGAVPAAAHQDREGRQARGPGPARARRASTRSTTTATRTSSPAASASASASRGRSPSSPSSSSPTSRCRPSTCRSRPRSSTCSRTSRTSWA